MTLLEHLEELRRRIIIIAVAVAAAGIVGFVLSDAIIALLRAPLPDDGAQLVQLTVGEALAVRLKVAFFVGLVLAMPVILFELWRFVTPGLTTRERRLVWPMLLLAVILFALGIGLGYVIIPFAVNFLLGLGFPDVPPLLSLSEYVSFVTTMMIAFGIVFEFPVVLLLLARVGVLEYRFLAARRRWAVLLIVLFAIVATPGGDPISPTVLTIVMYGLFEATLQVIRLMRR
jgi:sec-independent protein translocase protein TatC